MADTRVSYIDNVAWANPPTMDEFAKILSIRYKVPMYRLTIDLAPNVLFYCSVERKVFVVLNDQASGKFRLGFFHSSRHSRNLIPFLSENILCIT